MFQDCVHKFNDFWRRRHHLLRLIYNPKSSVNAKNHAQQNKQLTRRLLWQSTGSAPGTDCPSICSADHRRLLASSASTSPSHWWQQLLHPSTVQPQSCLARPRSNHFPFCLIFRVCLTCSSDLIFFGLRISSYLSWISFFTEIHLISPIFEDDFALFWGHIIWSFFLGILLPPTCVIQQRKIRLTFSFTSTLTFHSDP